MRRRAELQEETRRRILDAAAALSRGGSASLTAIADEAGVGRVTLYRHFADESSLLQACLGDGFEREPVPDGQAHRGEADPARRLRLVLRDLYRWYEDHGGILDAYLGTEPDPKVARSTLKPLDDALERTRDVVLDGSSAGRRGSLVAGALRHALEYRTWASLRRAQQMSNAQAVELMAGLVQAARSSLGPPAHGIGQPAKPESAATRS